MIGVAVNDNELDVVKEFFELFKTPWERAVRGRQYRVALVADGSSGTLNAETLLIYGSRGLEIDLEIGIAARQVSGPVNLEWKEGTFPIYKEVRVFESEPQDAMLTIQGQSAAYRCCIEKRVIWRIGYDLFGEIRFLLTEGQSVEHALTPTLEFHIAVLRDLLTVCQIPFVEILPRPHGYDFICCLTHDVDFFGIRRHLFDRTMAGFLYRASLGTAIDFIRGRRSFKEAYQNWLAFLSLPLVLLRVLPDFWHPFEDYAKVENTHHSTFFLVPFKERAGLSPDGSLNRWRATSYGIKDVQEDLMAAAAGGSELALHGIDAWRDADAGQEELNQLAVHAGQKAAGVRMHWLYFDGESPKKLEKAGFSYDSTCGYNEAVGYRAGTSQPFCPIGCSVLMELPMSIMDSALFSSGRMGLTSTQAMPLCKRIVDHAKRAGGALVINWHDRSLAPERLWGRFYGELLKEIREGGRVWFAKALEAVEWFRWRRSIRFCRTDFSGESERIHIAVPQMMGIGALLYIHRVGASGIETEAMPIDGGGLLSVEV